MNLLERLIDILLRELRPSARRHGAEVVGMMIVVAFEAGRCVAPSGGPRSTVFAVNSFESVLILACPKSRLLCAPCNYSILSILLCLREANRFRSLLTGRVHSFTYS